MAAVGPTIDPPNTTSGNNSASQEVMVGVGVTVAAHTHTHDTNIASFTGGTDGKPAALELLPYFRR